MSSIIIVLPKLEDAKHIKDTARRRSPPQRIFFFASFFFWRCLYETTEETGNKTGKQ